MHGLIFETSIWLLAGSTRLPHKRSLSLACLPSHPRASKRKSRLLAQEIVALAQLNARLLSTRSGFILPTESIPSFLVRLLNSSCPRGRNYRFNIKEQCRLTDGFGVNAQPREVITHKETLATTGFFTIGSDESPSPMHYRYSSPISSGSLLEASSRLCSAGAVTPSCSATLPAPTRETLDCCFVNEIESHTTVAGARTEQLLLQTSHTSLLGRNDLFSAQTLSLIYPKIWHRSEFRIAKTGFFGRVFFSDDSRVIHFLKRHSLYPTAQITDN